MGSNPYQIQILSYVEEIHLNEIQNKIQKLILDVDDQNTMYVFASKGT